MMRMTEGARQRMDEYLGRVRRALSANPDVDAGEVAADVRTHLEAAIAGRPEPVVEDDVAAVIDRLGAPGRWAPVDEIHGWRGVVAKLRRGPDDWRLAYLSFGLTCLGILTLPIGGALLLIPAFVLARGVLVLAEELDGRLGVDRWLVYPVLMAGYAGVLVALLAIPIPVGIGAFVEGELLDSLRMYFHFGFPGVPREGTAGSVGLVILATGVWWTVLGAVAAIRPTWVRSLFRPFADHFRRAYAWLPVLIGIAVSILGILAILLTIS